MTPTMMLLINDCITPRDPRNACIVSVDTTTGTSGLGKLFSTLCGVKAATAIR